MTEKELKTILDRKITITFERLMDIATTYACTYSSVGIENEKDIDEIRVSVFEDLHENKLGMIPYNNTTKSYDC